MALGPAKGLTPCIAGLEEMERGQQACRRLVNTLHQLATMHSVWSSSERKAVARAADELASNLRDVFVVEETIVFPQLRATLAPSVRVDLHERLVAHERLHTGRGEHERHVSMAEALAQWSDPSFSPLA